jgi:hypothetical protein
VLHEQERTDRQMRLVARDDRAAVYAPEQGNARNPVRRAKSKKGRPEQLHEYGTTRAWYEHTARLVWREEQHCASDA